MERAADTSNRFKIGVDGVTSHERIEGTEASSPIVTFGEEAYWNTSKEDMRDTAKIDPAWHEGIDSGPLWNSNAYVIGTLLGTFKSQSTKAMPEELPWGLGAVEDIAGTSWRPLPGKGDFKLQIGIGEGDFEIDGELGGAKLAIHDGGEKPSIGNTAVEHPGAKTTASCVIREDMSRYGATHKCPACTIIGGGSGGECRSRILRSRVDVGGRRKRV